MIDSKTFRKQYNHPHLKNLEQCLQRGIRSLFLKGLAGSSKALFCARFFELTKIPGLIILPDKESAAYVYNDLRNLLGDGSVFFFPSSYKRSVQYHRPDPSNMVVRTEILNLLASAVRTYLIVSYPESLMEKVPLRKSIKDHTLYLNKGEKVDLRFVEEVFREYGFEQTDFVYEPGQFSIRGSILDIFSFSNEHPFRIDFSGNEVESIRTFEVESQLSVETRDKISILPNMIGLAQEQPSGDFFETLKKTTIIWSSDLNYAALRIRETFDETKPEDLPVNDTESIPDKTLWLLSGDRFLDCADAFRNVELQRGLENKKYEILDFHTSSQPVFNKNFELLGSNFNENQNRGYQNYLLTENEKQIERLETIFENINEKVEFIPARIILHEGFIDHHLKICCYTDHQIFERYHRFHLRGNFLKREAISVKELTGLKPGDFVVHIDHGIGRFAGLEKTTIQGKQHEVVKLVYKDLDTLYVSIHALHRISKYKGKDSESPRIYKLGSAAWQNLKQKTRKKVKDIARELVSLYALRLGKKGFAFSPDTYLQKELEASFLYEDTPDQLSATRSVKDDMEESFPMDRLVCGDVGFGKTEVAIRAAFKAVTDSKQVALLVPTTILALQHYNTFQERLKNFPCTIDYISRFRKPGQQKKILENLGGGKLDIIIGTHRLVSKDVQYKNLGLLIIDEEQKFGVAVKEKIRQIKIDVDTLTLTATPIPRTLQFSLMGARDLSMIRTPPPNRIPIITELHRFKENIIKEGIQYEISRGGQVFFIHNRIETIEEIQKFIAGLLPKVRSVIAHGQMKGSKLEAAMLDFINGDFDVLIATAIIESGLDIPNANTIFINNPHHFGLSDLHQLRGRVGRSNKKAFCYLLAPPTELQSPEARRRLQAIEEFSDLGSGFNIAMQDLDIRGAGNLLGAEQSGFIAEMGFEMYQRILQETLQELKEQDFKEAFASDTKPQDSGKELNFVNDVYFETDLELLFPDGYIENISERLRLYRALDAIATEEELRKFKLQLEDRFGPVPQPALELMNIVWVREQAKKMGIVKVILKKQKLILNFLTNEASPFYRSEVFGRMLSIIQTKPAQYRMKELNGKLTLAIPGINSVLDVKAILEDLSVKIH